MTEASTDLSLHHELEKQAGFLRTVARRLVVGELADDVAQTACLEALRSQPETAGGLKGWLALVTRRLAGRMRREAGRRSIRERSAARSEIVDLPLHGDASDALQIVSGAVARLDEPYRSTVLALYYRGMSAEDLGRELGLPAATIRTRHRRALDMLRGKLDREFGGDRAAWCLTLLPLLPKKLAAAVASACAPATTTSTVAAGGALKGGFAIAASLLVAVSGIFFASRESGLDDFTLDDGSSLLRPADSERPLAPRRGVVGSRFAGFPAARRDDRRAISGATFATGSLRVHAIDGLTKSALPGIRIWVGGADAMQGAFPHQALTDERGDALFPDLAAGRYAIGFFGGAVAAADVHAGSEANVDVTLLADDQVDGVVVDSKDAPIQGAEIAFILADDIIRYHTGVESDSNGRFVVRGVRGRALSFLASHRSFPDSSFASIDANGAGDGPLKLVVAATTGTITGRVVDKNGAPVANAIVHYDRGGTIQKHVVLGPKADARYSFTKAWDGSAQRIEVILGAAAATSQSGDAESTRQSRMVIATTELKESEWRSRSSTSVGAETVTIDAAISNRLLPSESEWNIGANAVVVTSDASASLKSLAAGKYGGFHSGFFFSDRGALSFTKDGGDGRGPRNLSTKTDENGRFTLRGVPLGQALIAVDAKGFAPSETETVVTEDEDPYVRVYLADPVTAKGRLVDAEGAPVAGAVIRAAGLRTFARSATTDASGSFLIRDLPPGRMSFDIERRAAVEDPDSGSTRAISRSAPFEVYLYDGDNDLGDRVFTASTVENAALFYTGVEQIPDFVELDLVQRLGAAK